MKLFIRLQAIEEMDFCGKRETHGGRDNLSEISSVLIIQISLKYVADSISVVPNQPGARELHMETRGARKLRT